jgi:hypothetical protein
MVREEKSVRASFDIFEAVSSRESTKSACVKNRKLSLV